MGAIQQVLLGSQITHELHISVAASTDDCDTNKVNTIYPTETTLRMGTYEVGMRFLNVTIPKDSFILAATITFVGGGASSGGDCIVKIYGEDVDSSATFSTFADFDGRSLTTAYTDWTRGNTGTGTTYLTPSIVPVIQEIVNRASWASGNDLSIIIKDNGSSTYRIFVAWDGDTGTDAAILNIIYQ